MSNTKKIFTFKFIVFILILGMSSVLQAQNVSSIDFESLKASDLSDQQLRQLWERAQEQGYSLQEVQQLAVIRGMDPAEASKLANRVRQLRSQGVEESGVIKKDASQLRTVDKDSLLSQRQDTAVQIDSTKERSRIFGASLFNQKNISFAPSLNIPTPEGYQLGAGDELVVDIWGATDQTLRLQVSPDGTVSLPRLGPIYVNGLTIEEARERLRDDLAQIYSGLAPNEEGKISSHLRITLGNIRSIRVTIVGNVEVPGTYTLPSLATAFNALYLAGGPDSLGTYRNIKIIRQDSIIAHLDLYNFLVYGKQPGNIRLRDQDIIMIGTYDERVVASGRLKRNGIFEMRNKETIEDLLKFTGGFSEKAYTKRIKVIRETPEEMRIEDIKYPEQHDFALANGDSIYVGRILSRFENRVTINGAVYREGSYELQDTTTVYSLIQRAEGLRGDAFMNRGLIYREQPDLTTKSIPFNVRDLINNPEENNIALKEGDQVVISSIFDLRDEYNIRIFGAVQQPGQYLYVEGMTLEDAIFQANGFKESAAPYRIEVARRINKTDSVYVPTEITETFQFSVSRNLTLDENGSNFILQPYDQIFIRNSPSYFEQQNVAINGQVLFPGTYAMQKQNMRISDLVREAGGLTRYAYAEGASLTRLVEQEIDTAFVNIGDTLETEQSIASNKTKVGINLPRIMKHPGSEFDLILRKGDNLEIPKKLETVRLAGEVLQPVSVRYQDDRSFKDYIRAAGGATNRGAVKDAYIVYANGSVDRASRFLFFRNYPEVKPGSTIFVPQKELDPDLSPQERIGILSAVVSMLAIVSNSFFRR